MKVSDEFFEVFYNELSEGQKQHMSNKIYKETGRYPQKLNVSAREQVVYKRGDRLTHKGSGRTYVLVTAMVAGRRYLFAANPHTGAVYAQGVHVPHGDLMPEAVNRAFACHLRQFKKEL